MGGIKAAYTNLKKGNIAFFDMKYKKKRDDSQHFYVDHRAFKNDFVIFPSKTTKPLRFRKGEKKWLLNHIQKLKNQGKSLSDMTIMREKPGMYFIQIPYDQPIIDDKIKMSAISIDPGVITQGTFYDPSGKCGKVGDGLGKKIGIINMKIDAINSKISKEINKKKKMKKQNKKIVVITKLEKDKIKKKLSKKVDKLNIKMYNMKETEEIYNKKDKIRRIYKKIIKVDLKMKENNKNENINLIKKSRKRIKKLKNKIRLARKKIKNVVKDAHDKAISFYCTNYKYIIIPKLDAKSIAKKQKSQGMKKEARKTMSISPGKFMERLKTKIGSYKDRHLMIVKEDYTSQTCGRCGIINKEIKKKRIFECPECEHKQDRDTNSARSILIRGLLKIKESQK